MRLSKPVIDSHIHLFAVEDENKKSYIEAFDEYQERCGFKAVNICCCTCSYGDAGNNILAALYKLHNPTAFAYGCMNYATYPVSLPVAQGMEAITQYDELMDIGFDGIKIIETKPYDIKLLNLPVNGGFYDELFSAAERDGTHIIWHVADPGENWDINKVPEWAAREGWYYGDGSYPSYEEIYDRVFDVLNKYPKLNVTFAHFFFLSGEPDKLEKIFDRFPNVSIDLVPGSEMYNDFEKNRKKYEAFFEKYSDRIIYGTDITFPVELSNWDHLAEEVYRAITTDGEIEIYGVRCKGFKLPDGACNKILFENFERVCAGKPAKINIAALKKYIKKYSRLIADDAVKQFINRQIEKSE